MIKTTIKWHNAKEERPEKSGEYLCKISRTQYTDLPYSKEHDAFNVHDRFESDDLMLALNVMYWAELSDLAALESAEEEI